MKSLYSASALASPCAPPSRYHASAIASFALARYSLVSYVLIRFCKSRRAISKRLCSISLIALSNSTLSGCCVSLLMGLSYLWRRNPQPPSSTTAAVTAADIFIALRTIVNHSPKQISHLDRGGARRDLTH